jgi:2OG-Fe(II) oxygenase superfamily
MSDQSTFTTPYRVIDNFLPDALARQMRSAIEQHFSKPNQQGAAHEVWNYWHVPETYTYLRTNPEKVIPREQVARFMQLLKSWTWGEMGMDSPYWPFLSMYVDGCKQEMHNDSTNGRFAYVYSLTKPDRLTTGGETVVFHEGNFFRDNLHQSKAGRGFFDLVPPLFNRLVVFDDRIPHAVKMVQGVMDPLEARFVFHGHINETPLHVEGALSEAAVLQTLAPNLAEFSALPDYHGPLVLRFAINALGRVGRWRVLVDRVAGQQADRSPWQARADPFYQRLQSQRFAASHGETVVTLPLLFGGPLKRL